MSAEQTVYRILAADSALAGLVDGRIYQDLIPQADDLPAVAYSRSGTEPVATIHGAVVGAFVTIQLQAWARTRTAAEQVAEAITAALAASGETYVARGALFDDETRACGVAIDVTVFDT